jgi:hypothetical protein
MNKKAHSQSEHFTIRGHWWLPGANQRVAGVLRYTEGDLTLSLYGGLCEVRVESPFSATPTRTEFPVILVRAEEPVLAVACDGVCKRNEGLTGLLVATVGWDVIPTRLVQ